MSYFHPQRMPVLSARRRDAARRQLEEVVEQSAATARQSSKNRRRMKPPIIATAVAAIILSTGAAAFAIVAYQPVTDRSHARCYTAADVNDGYYQVVVVAGDRGSRPQVRSALDTCSDLFRQGYLRPGFKGVNLRPDTSVPHRVPPLVVCTMPDGSAAVFPGRPGTCARLRLAAATRQ